MKQWKNTSESQRKNTISQALSTCKILLNFQENNRKEDLRQYTRAQKALWSINLFGLEFDSLQLRNHKGTKVSVGPFPEQNKRPSAESLSHHLSHHPPHCPHTTLHTTCHNAFSLLPP